MVMVRTALLAGAGVIAAACVACTPKPQPPPPGPPPEHRAQICNPDDADSFIRSVHFLKSGYDPADPYTRFADPPITDEPLPSVVEADLRSAFTVAPPFFKDDVCKLDGIFINQTDCDDGNLRNSCFDASWGFRSPLEPNRGKRYIAISLSNWTAGRPLRRADSRYGGRKPEFRHAQRLTEYNTRQLNTLLKSLNHLTWKAPPKFDSKISDDTANSPGMAVLAVLAHELGHVRWYDFVEPDPGLNHEGNYDLSRLKCPDGSNFLDSWNPVVSRNKAFAAPEWLPFGQPADEHLVVHAPETGPPITDFTRPGQRASADSQSKADMDKGRHRDNQPLVALAVSLDDLYGDNRPWASLLGSLSPTEDLVETYVLLALKRARPSLVSLRLNISSPDGRVFQEDIADLSSRPALTGKLDCVSALDQAYR
jgi:hypothetical protein